MLSQVYLCITIFLPCIHNNSVLSSIIHFHTVFQHFSFLYHSTAKILHYCLQQVLFYEHILKLAAVPSNYLQTSKLTVTHVILLLRENFISYGISSADFTLWKTLCWSERRLWWIRFLRKWELCRLKDFGEGRDAEP